ncbi:MAG: flagellar hook-length control protein FliK [Chloroflexota bacterium]
MNMNLMEVLPVSKPPPESAPRAARPSGEARRDDAPTFEEALRARQKEEKQTQSQAEAAASQSAAAAQQTTPPRENQPGAETPAVESGETQPAARVGGGLLALLNEGGVIPALENGAAAKGDEIQPLEGLVAAETPAAGESLPVEGKVDFAAALEQSLSQPAEEVIAQPQASTEVKIEKSASTEVTPEVKVETHSNPKASAEVRQAQPAGPQTVIEQQSVLHPPKSEPIIPLRSETVHIQSRPLVDMVRQIADQMEASIQQGRSSLRVQLHPQELGGIDIRFASSAQGVSVTVYAEQASTGRLLEAQLNQLRQSLNDAGVNLTQLNIHHESPSHQSSGGFGGHQPRGRSFGGRESEAHGGLALERLERWQNLSAGGVDYRI